MCNFGATRSFICNRESWVTWPNRDFLFHNHPSLLSFALVISIEEVSLVRDTLPFFAINTLYLGYFISILMQVTITRCKVNQKYTSLRIKFQNVFVLFNELRCLYYNLQTLKKWWNFDILVYTLLCIPLICFM